MFQAENYSNAGALKTPPLQKKASQKTKIQILEKVKKITKRQTAIKQEFHTLPPAFCTLSVQVFHAQQKSDTSIISELNVKRHFHLVWGLKQRSLQLCSLCVSIRGFRGPQCRHGSTDQGPPSVVSTPCDQYQTRQTTKIKTILK